MDADKTLRKYEDEYEYHFHDVDREWIIKAMNEYAQQQVKNTVDLGSVSGAYTKPTLELRHIRYDYGDLKVQQKWVDSNGKEEWITLKIKE